MANSKPYFTISEIINSIYSGTEANVITDVNEVLNTVYDPVNKALKVSGSGGGSDVNAVHVNVADEINLIDEKTVINENDILLIEDSEDVNNKKKVLIKNVISTVTYETVTDPAVNAAVTTSIIDDNSGVIITLTASGNSQTLSTPTLPTVREFTVSNNDTSSDNILINNILLSPGEAQKFLFDGTVWVLLSAIDAKDISIIPSRNIKDTNVKDAIYNLDINKDEYKRGFDRLNPDSMGNCSYDFTTRTFSIEPKAGQSSFTFYAKGVFYEKTVAENITFPDVSGTYYFYFDVNGDLQYDLHTDLTEEIFLTSAITGLCYYDAVDKIGEYASDEQHGLIISPSTHFNLHMTRGFKWAVGGDIEGLTDGGDTFSKITASLHFDEDIPISTAEITTKPFMYRSGANGEWKLTSSTNKIGYIKSGDTYVSFNKKVAGVWGLEESTSSTDYIIMFDVKTNFAVTPYRTIIGQSAFPNRSSARDALLNELELVKLEGLPSTEIEFEAAYICKRNGTLEDDGNGNTHIDLRTLDGTAGASNATIWLRDGATNTITTLNTNDNLNLNDGTLSAGNIIGHRSIGTSITGTTYTFALTDKNRYIRCSNASAQVLTVPTNSSVAFPIGTEIELIQAGVGEVSLVAASGVTINSKDSNLKIDSQYSVVVLKKVTTDEWDLIGDLKA